MALTRNFRVTIGSGSSAIRASGKRCSKKVCSAFLLAR